ncbi:uncharacterized protein LOC113126571 isoform X1 [Mastacembelus armatus]|uniref:uncharacterized protein LOC113126571 isoform X1 n=2 Tax=Mastacembelus armatus TaxID=205130 RepID=UPI000E45A413|nr:uncharacterized protein LOC113126571 isoform X1 [Mastacembelus armatus]
MTEDPVNPYPLASQMFCQSDFSKCNGKTGSNYLQWVSHAVSKWKHRRCILNNPAGTVLKIAELGDTIYRDEKKVVNGWGKFYLPDIVNMQVFGVVEGTSCPCDELVLMTREDNKQVYVYDGEELHLVASNLRQVFEEGIEYPASKTYYRGEAFKDMTNEDWAEVKKGPVGKRLDQEHRTRVTARKSRFLDNLRTIEQKIGVVS